MLVAVRRQSLRREVTRILCGYIVDTRLRDGDRLPGQRDLANFLQVSRTVVREALSSMEAQGIIEIRVGDGAVVRNAAAATRLTDASHEVEDLPTRDLTEFMSALYLGLADLMCERATAADVEALDSLLVKMEAKLRVGKTILAEVQDFFWLLAALSRNAIVLQLRPLRSEVDRRGLLTQSSIIGKPTDKALEHLEHHREMVGAIVARDSARLRRAFRREFAMPDPDGAQEPSRLAARVRASRADSRVARGAATGI